MRLACNGLPVWFERKAVIVTPSRLLANVAGQQFTRHQLEQGIDSWRRPCIYDVDAWLAACWQEARYSGSTVPALLSPAQERIVWQDIIEQEQPALFDVASTIRLAISASRLMAEWQIPPQGEIWNDYQDAQHFLRWQQRFRQKCSAESWISRSDVWHLLPGWIADGLCKRQATVFAAFEVFTPALQQIRNVLGAHAPAEPVANTVAKTGVAAQSCATFAKEIEQAARLARTTFERNPRESVAVFVPDLSAQRALVDRTFAQIFYPAAALRLMSKTGEHDATGRESSVFHLNAARSLKDQPIIANALLLLELAKPRIAMADACAILRSPFIAGAAVERNVRALADLSLRRRRDIDVSLRDMEYATADCIRLRSIWPEVRNRLTSGPPYRYLPAWSEFIRDLVEVLGWPGDADLSPEELDTVELWKNAVSALASLGLVSKAVSYETALTRLRGLLLQQGAEHGDWSSPVQILDAADASALQFDSALLTGLSDDRWPPASPSSALVPLKVQRAHDVPGSSRRSAHEMHQRMTDSLFRVAPNLNATFSGRLSPLAAQFTEEKSALIREWRGTVAVHSYTPTALDEIDDSFGPPFSLGKPIRGGTGIIKSQSLCPFRGFAEYRLQSSVPEEACFGFDSRDRGQFLHKALQTVWELLKTQDRLRATSPEELRAIVRNSVLTAVRDNGSSAFYQLTTDAERDRLEKLILEWLDIERLRNQPFTVDSVEQKRSYEIPGLRLDLRVDRIDRLKNGGVLLIDYKSGKQTAGKLEGERPAEPQLLVYAAAVDEPVDGVFFGQLKPRELRAVGFGRERHFPGRAANVKKGWDTFIAESAANVENIAAGFVKGDAVVDPIKGACEYCNQKPFCRVREKSSMAGESEVDAD